ELDPLGAEQDGLSLSSSGKRMCGNSEGITAFSLPARWPKHFSLTPASGTRGAPEESPRSEWPGGWTLPAVSFSCQVARAVPWRVRHSSEAVANSPRALSSREGWRCGLPGGEFASSPLSPPCLIVRFRQQRRRPLRRNRLAARRWALYNVGEKCTGCGPAA